MPRRELEMRSAGRGLWRALGFRALGLEGFRASGCRS